MAVHKLQHGVGCLTQQPFIGNAAHHLADRLGRQLGYHARDVGGGHRGAMREDGGVDHQQFTARARLAPQQDPAEAYLAVHLQDDLGQLPSGRDANRGRRRSSTAFCPGSAFRASR